MTHMGNVLVLCTGNSCRSQMAQAYLQSFLPAGNQVFSAGVDPKPLHPFTLQVMQEDGYDVSNSTSNHFDELAHIKFAWILTGSETAQESAPIWVRFGKVIHQYFYDPSKAEGTEEERLTVFRKVRDEIKEFCKEIAQDPIAEPENWKPAAKKKEESNKRRNMIAQRMSVLNRFLNRRRGEFA